MKLGTERIKVIVLLVIWRNRMKGFVVGHRRGGRGVLKFISRVDKKCVKSIFECLTNRRLRHP